MKKRIGQLRMMWYILVCIAFLLPSFALALNQDLRIVGINGQDLEKGKLRISAQLLDHSGYPLGLTAADLKVTVDGVDGRSGITRMNVGFIFIVDTSTLYAKTERAPECIERLLGTDAKADRTYNNLSLMYLPASTDGVAFVWTDDIQTGDLQFLNVSGDRLLGREEYKSRYSNSAKSADQAGIFQKLKEVMENVKESRYQYDMYFVVVISDFDDTAADEAGYKREIQEALNQFPVSIYAVAATNSGLQNAAADRGISNMSWIAEQSGGLLLTVDYQKNKNLDHQNDKIQKRFMERMNAVVCDEVDLRDAAKRLNCADGIHTIEISNKAGNTYVWSGELALSQLPAPAAAAAPVTSPSLNSSSANTEMIPITVAAEEVFARYGEENENVKMLQDMLISLNYYSGFVDGKFLAGTRKAWIQFVKRNQYDCYTDAEGRLIITREQWKMIQEDLPYAMKAE